LSEAPVDTEVIARTVVWARAGAATSNSNAALTFIAVSNDDEWLRAARRVLVNRPGVIGLVSVGDPLDSTAVSRHLAGAMSRLTGKRIGLIPQWRSWGPAPVAEERASGLVEISPAAPRRPDAIEAVTVLSSVVAQARVAFPHLVVDLAELPLRHPATLASADVLVTVASSGGVREEHLLAVERLLPEDRNLGVMLID
jgi:hypothetical protein